MPTVIEKKQRKTMATKKQTKIDDLTTIDTMRESFTSILDEVVEMEISAHNVYSYETFQSVRDRMRSMRDQCLYVLTEVHAVRSRLLVERGVINSEELS